ncbi:hypothetical protein BaRGS_00007767 [Batillaria attramentaria]|uniref:Uncharacterized protein n=1 Tax=Batillaria attramentaria TaxID=370345 RepID=A0ABD0LNH7_9CAEN
MPDLLHPPHNHPLQLHTTRQTGNTNKPGRQPRVDQARPMDQALVPTDLPTLPLGGLHDCPGAATVDTASGTGRAKQCNETNGQVITPMMTRSPKGTATIVGHVPYVCTQTTTTKSAEANEAVGDSRVVCTKLPQGRNNPVIVLETR